MSRSPDLPAVAWEVLAQIDAGAPLTKPVQIQWAKAFGQICWAESEGGRWVLTRSGRAALKGAAAASDATRVMT